MNSIGSPDCAAASTSIAVGSEIGALTPDGGDVSAFVLALGAALEIAEAVLGSPTAADASLIRTSPSPSSPPGGDGESRS